VHFKQLWKSELQQQQGSVKSMLSTLPGLAPGFPSYLLRNWTELFLSFATKSVFNRLCAKSTARERCLTQKKSLILFRPLSLTVALLPSSSLNTLVRAADNFSFALVHWSSVCWI